MGELEKHHKFFLRSFRGRNFETHRNFDEKPANQSFQNSPKSLPEAKKYDFSPKSHSIRPISWKSVKTV